MPMNIFKPAVKKRGVSIDSAKQVAKICKTSLTATLWRMVKTNLEKCALILWKNKNKPKELPEVHTTFMFKDEGSIRAPKKLRVRRAVASSGAGYIPPHKSVEQDTKIYKAYSTNQLVKGYDKLELSSTIKGTFYTESLPYGRGEDKQVITLLHFQDPGSGIRPKAKRG